MNNKKRKIILNLWVIFIVIILLILLFLLGLRLPKLPKKDSQQKENQKQTQYEYQYKYIYDTNKVQNIVRLLTELKTLKQLKNKQLQNQVVNQKETQPINNKVFVPSQEAQSQFDWNSNYDNDDNKLIKDIAVVTLTTGAVVIGCVVLTPIFAFVGPIAAPLALLL